MMQLISFLLFVYYRIHRRGYRWISDRIYGIVTCHTCGRRFFVISGMYNEYETKCPHCRQAWRVVNDGYNFCLRPLGEWTP